MTEQNRKLNETIRMHAAIQCNKYMQGTKRRTYWSSVYNTANNLLKGA